MQKRAEGDDNDRAEPENDHADAPQDFVNGIPPHWELTLA